MVCAGAKAILDIPKTLEVLETKGVPVIGYGTDEFPAFWTRSSGYPVDHRLDTPEAAAALIETQFALGLGGVLVANPIPAKDALDADDDRQPPSSAAIARRRPAGRSTRKALTPYLLQRIFELTGGKSLVSNIALVENNARVATAHRASRSPRGAAQMSDARVLVVGDVMTDIIVLPEGPMVRGSDRRATIRSRPGGSGANQAVWLARFGAKVRVRSARGGGRSRRHIGAFPRASASTPMLAGDPRRAVGRADLDRRCRRRAELPHRPRRQSQPQRRRPAADPARRHRPRSSARATRSSHRDRAPR